MADELLFYTHRLSQTVDNHRGLLQAELDKMTDERLLNTDLAELQRYGFDKWKLDLPSLGEPIVDEGRTKMEVGRYGGGYDFGSYDASPVEVDAHRYTLEIPFEGDPDLMQHQGSTFSSNPPRGTVRGNLLTMTVVERNPTPEALNHEFERFLANVQQHLDWMKDEVAAWNRSIPAVVSSAVDHRRQRAEQVGSVARGLKFAVKPRGDSAATFRAPVAPRRKVVPQLPAAKAGAKPEPVLADDTYRSILETLNQMSLVMERSPHAYATMDEETLRFQFLVPLNANFEGEARGEVFNYGGKTDILITVQGRNIFVAECKFWRGAKSFSDTIDQILGYLTWRDTKCAILIFNRNKGFSQVLEQIRPTAEAHSQFVKYDGSKSETELAFTFRRPNDPDRKLVLTVLAFDIPGEE